jgi:hypothetical protein
MVSFLTQLSSTSSPVAQQRIFDYQITSEAQTYYEQEMAIIQYALLDGVSWTPSGGVGSALTPSEVVATVQNAVRALNTWSQYMYVDDTGAQMTNGAALPSSFTSASSMSQYMAQALDTLIRTMTAAGFNPLSIDASEASLETAVAAIQADDVSTTPIYSMRSVISKGLSAAANAVIIGDSSTLSQSIQQLLMVDYITSGNEILYGEMNQLQTAVSLNQNILTYLNSLQDLMNQKDPQSFLMSLENLNSSSPDYSQFEKSTYTQILGTVPKFTDAQLSTYLIMLNAQNSGEDLDDPLIQAKYGLISSSAGMLALFDELTSSASLSYSTPSLSSDAIQQNGLTNYDLALYQGLTAAEIAAGSTSALTSLTTAQKYQNGITNAFDSIYLDMVQTGLSAGLLTADVYNYGLYSMNTWNSSLLSSYKAFQTWANTYNLDPSDTNATSMFFALKDLAFVATSSDPTDLQNQIDAGLGGGEGLRIEKILNYLSANSLSISELIQQIDPSGSADSLLTDSPSTINWNILKTIGLTNVSTFSLVSGPSGSLVNISSDMLHYESGYRYGDGLTDIRYRNTLAGDPLFDKYTTQDLDNYSTYLGWCRTNNFVPTNNITISDYTYVKAVEFLAQNLSPLDPSQAISSGLIQQLETDAGSVSIGVPLGQAVQDILNSLNGSVSNLHVGDVEAFCASVIPSSGSINLNPLTSAGILSNSISSQSLPSVDSILSTLSGIQTSEGKIPSATIPALLSTAYNLSNSLYQSFFNFYAEAKILGYAPTSDTTAQSFFNMSNIVLPFDPTVYGAASGTAPSALVDIISGQFNGDGGVEAIINNLTALIQKTQQYVDSQSGASVVTELQQILADFNTAKTESPSNPISYWVQNFSNQNEGTNQAHLNNAITASQALNDTEREKLQQVMFIYQEFYQSASSMLSALNTLFQTIASNISSQ